MHPKSAVAVALLAAAPIVSAGNAVLKNACSFPIYAWTVTDYQGEMQTIQSGGEYSQAYQTNSDGGGVSMKIATNPSTAGSITQYEYTLESTLWYDISNINGNPFQQWGLSLVPSISSCRSVVCDAGVEACSAVYNTPDQNWATAACDPSADTVLTLCSTNGNANVGHEHEHKHHHHHHHHKGTSVSTPVPSITSVYDQVSSSITYNNYGAPMTTFVTQVVTITARDAEASPAAAEEQPVRRHMHQHHYHPHGRN